MRYAPSAARRVWKYLGVHIDAGQKAALRGVRVDPSQSDEVPDATYGVSGKRDLLLFLSPPLHVRLSHGRQDGGSLPRDLVLKQLVLVRGLARIGSP